MGTSYEHFVACLRTAASRRLIGVSMSDEEALALAADDAACRAYFKIWSAAAAPVAPPVAQKVPTAAPERVLLDITTGGPGATPVQVLVTTERLAMSSRAGLSG